jgi:predicted nucleic acid-binding Zn ribbon protein
VTSDKPAPSDKPTSDRPAPDEPTAGTAQPPSAEPSGTGGDADAGADAVRQALNRAKAAAREKRLAPNNGRRGARSRGRTVGRSGSGPDARDPQPFGLAIQWLIDERGWDASVAVGGAIGRWPEVVGPDIAAHCEPEGFDDGVLTVRAESTTWATQVRLLVPAILRSLDERLGEGTVTKIVVKGPGGPSWRHGPRVAPGSQGPRDTYG